MSSRTGEGISGVWETLCDYRNIIIDTGELTRRRAEQRKNWMWAYIQAHLLVVKSFYVYNYIMSINGFFYFLMNPVVQ